MLYQTELHSRPPCLVLSSFLEVNSVSVLLHEVTAYRMEAILTTVREVYTLIRAALWWSNAESLLCLLNVEAIGNEFLDDLPELFIHLN